MLIRIAVVGLLIGICGCVRDEEYASMPTLFLMDDYDRCMMVQEKSLYCSFTYQLQPINIENSSEVWGIVKEVSSNIRNYRHDLLRHKICVRESCPHVILKNNNEQLTEEINECYDTKYKDLGLKGTISNLKCVTADSKYPVGIFDKIVIYIFISYILFVIFASLYEGSARYKPKEEYERITSTRVGWFLSAFSLPKNYYRLTAKNTNPDAIKLQSIQGIRLYTMFCVVMAHTIMYHLRGPVMNPKYTENITKHVQNMIIINGNVCVQTFFLISGWLLTFHFFQMFENHKTIQPKLIFLAIFNRLIRLLPTLMVVLVFHSTWLVHLGEGPSWDELVAEDCNNCRNYWWTNILFVNNLIHAEHMCLQQTWYLAADTQLFLVTMLILTLVWKYRSKAKYIFAVCHVVGIAIPAFIAYTKNYDIQNRQYPELVYHLRSIRNPLWIEMYAATYTNIGGWMVGVTFGYIFYLYKDKQIFTNKIYVALWWIFVWTTCLSIVFSGYIMYQENYQYTPLGSALYWSLSKPLFALGIATGIFGFSQGIGWFMKWFCEWEAVEVFGRLTYSAYIIHLLFITYRVGIAREPTYLRDSITIYYVFGDISVAYMGATLLCLFIEMPISALQKTLVPQLSEERIYKQIKNDKSNNGKVKM